MRVALFVVATAQSWYDETENRIGPLEWRDEFCRGIDCDIECGRKANAIAKAQSPLPVGQCHDERDNRFRSDNQEPLSSIRCYDSVGYEDDSTDCDLCPKCSTKLTVRTCHFTNLYYDGETSKFLFYGSALPRECQAVLPGMSKWPVETVDSLPERERQVFQDDVLVCPQLHGAFAHGFLELLFTAYWIMAEIQSSWDPKPWTLFYDGYLGQLHSAAFQQKYDRCKGTAKAGWLRVWATRIVHPRRLYRGLPALSQGLTRFPSLVVSGQGGRSPWHGASYSTMRSFLVSDLEFSRAEKTAAFLRYFDKVEASVMPRQRYGPTKLDRLNQTTIARFFNVIILNREAKYARALEKVSAIAGAIERVIPSARVTATTPSKLKGEYPVNIIRLLRNASLIVSPHGAQLAHVAFAPAGAAVLEIQPSKCSFDLKNAKNAVVNDDGNPMYSYISRHAGLHHKIVRARNGGVCSCKRECPTLKVNVDAVAAAAKALKDLMTTSRTTHLARLQELLTDEPRSLATSYRQSCFLANDTLRIR